MVNKSLDDLNELLSASQAREEAALERIHQFDRCISAIATALGSPACGGVDEPSDPLGTAEVLVAAIGELREKLEAAELALLNEGATHGETKMHMRNLEARIKASQEQEPAEYQIRYPWQSAWVSCSKATHDYHANKHLEMLHRKLYAAPVIPPEMAELQRENEALRRQVSMEMVDHYQALQEENAELIRPLEEAKSKAAPEGWQLVPKEPTEAMLAAAVVYTEDADWIATGAYKAMLAAAPQPPKERT